MLNNEFMKKYFFFAICAMTVLLTACEKNEPSNSNTGSDISKNQIAFSVSADKQVTFSKGNLQYNPVNDKWSFADSQLETYNDFFGWHLFGWSADNTTAPFGVSTSGDRENDYLGSFVDWGTNTIGDDAPNTWRTLSNDEWEYLLNTRTNASSLKAVAQVNGVNGLIFLPDNWTCPTDVAFKSGFHSTLGRENYAEYQSFAADQWSLLESAGAVFLPAAGIRDSIHVFVNQYYGGYWSATEDGSEGAYYLSFAPNEAYMGYSSRYLGNSVRLVKDL